MSDAEIEPNFINAISSPFPSDSEYFIRRRLEDTADTNSEGQIGTDASGLDQEFYIMPIENHPNLGINENELDDTFQPIGGGIIDDSEQWQKYEQGGK